MSDLKKTKFIFHRDHFLITLLIVFVSLLTIFIPINTSFLNPVQRSFEDFSLSDLFLQFTDREHKPESNEVFIVDVTSIRDRGDMAKAISAVIALEPKAIVLDVIFETTDGNPDDVSLLETICASPVPILAASQYVEDKNGEFHKKSSYFTEVCGLPEGYVNTTINNSYSKSIRSYTTTQLLCDEVVLSLPMLAAQTYRNVSDKDFKERLINYTELKIKTVSHSELAELDDRAKDKLIIIGVASGREDAHLTPIGDMSGSEIVGLSIHSIIDKSYIRQMPKWLAIVLGVLLCFVYVVICSDIHLRYPKTDNIRIKTLQLLSVFVFVFINLLVSFYLNYNMSLVYIFVFIVLVGDMLSFYIYIQSWLNEKGWLKNPQKSLYL